MQSRAADITAVANKVLGLLGEDPTTDITVANPDTAAAIKLKVHLYDSIDEVQSSFYWQELIKAETITPDTEDHYDGRKRYALPDDCLRPLGVRCTEGASFPQTTYTQMAQDSDDYYQVEGGWLLTYAEGVDVVYITRDDNPTNWTAELLRCVVHCASVNAGQAITDDSQLVANLIQKYEQLVKPYARRLQSKYKTNERLLPRGFTNLSLRRY